MSFNRERLEKKFSEEYQRLNEKQRQAVDTIEGPVMVIAGPGTGKTQILASRIGKILLETDALPANILCLTYTEAGVVAMRKRLLGFIGPDAYKVNIYTFHAFCNDVIQDNLSLFEKTALDPVSDLEKIQLFKELIDTFPKDHPLKRYRGDVYFEIDNLDHLFSTMKKEGWTAAFINERIDSYLAELPTKDEYIYRKKTPKFKAGDLKIDKIREVEERMSRLRAAVGEYERFQQLMRRKNRYDFDDMINWVISAFEENKDLLANYQEKFQYILVDEYQDTSGTQNRLVQLLISYWDVPNVFVVGDDDQSIFRFQGANIENMLEFANSYKEALLTVVLTNNYRSTQPILNISKTLIDRNADRLVQKIDGLSKDLKSSNALIRDMSHKPVIREYETQRHEMIGITHHVRQLLNNNVLPGRIGIIYKEHKYGEELSRYFKLLSIPVYSKRNLNILELPLARKIILIMKYIASEHDVSNSGGEMLFEILHFDWFGVPPIDVAKFNMQVAARRMSDKEISLRRLLFEKAAAPAPDLFNTGIHPGLAKASFVTEELIADASNVTLQVLFENIIQKAGILSHIMSSGDKHWQLQILTGLFDFIKEETHRNPFLTLQQLVSLIELMETEKISLPLVQVNGTDKGVNLMTAHGSKGLEFEYIIFAGCNSGFWEKKKVPSKGYKMPDNIFSSQLAGSNEEELRRLFYVALTRAEQHLYISYSRYKNDGKELEPSMFIEEIQETHALPVEKMLIDEDVTMEFVTLDFTKPSSPEIGKIEEEFVARVLDKFVMNVTALNNYLKCPLEFYFKNLIRIPSPKNDAMEFGSSVHYALEKLFRKMQDAGNDVFPPKAEFLYDFEWYMTRHRESFTKEQFDRRMEYGKKVLDAYYENYIPNVSRIVAVERNISNVVVKNVPIKGKLDKLEFDGKSVNVVDYKTGDPDKSKPKLKAPSDKDPIGGDYWRQAVFYKILVDNYEQKDWKVVSTEFDFIEPDNKKTYRKIKVVISPEDIATVTRQIEETWAKIQARDFYTGCGDEKCQWCNFVKTHNMAVAFHDLHDSEE